MADPAHFAPINRLVEKKTANLVSEGKARHEAIVRGDGTRHELEPRNPRACRLVIEVDRESPLVVLEFGRYGTPAETYANEDLSKVEEYIGWCIDAVVAGRYTERVCVDGDRVRAVGRLELPHLTKRLTWNTLFGWLCPTGWQQIEYEPY